MRWSIAEHLVTKGDDAGRPQHPEDDLVRHRTPGSRGPEARSAARQDLPDPDAQENIARRAVDADELEFLVTSLDDRSEARPALLRGVLAGLEGQVYAEAPGQLGTGLRPAEARPQRRRPRPRGRTAVRRRRGRAAVPRDPRRRERAARRSAAGPSRASPTSSTRHSASGFRPCWTNRSCGSPRSAASPRSTEAGRWGCC